MYLLIPYHLLKIDTKWKVSTLQSNDFLMLYTK